MSLISYIGTERNILDETPQHCHTLKLPHPILTNRDLEKLRRVSQGDFLATTLPTLFPAADGEKGLRARARWLCRRASLAIQSGYTLLILSDRGVDRGLCADSQPAGADGRAQSSGARRTAHAGGADHRIRRAARSDALRAADRLRRERDQSVSGHRNAGRSWRSAAICRKASTFEKALYNYIKADQQGPAEGLLEDGHLDAAELSRRAGLRSHRPEQRSWSTSISPARRRASKAWGSTCWRAKPSMKHAARASSR